MFICKEMSHFYKFRIMSSGSKTYLVVLTLQVAWICNMFSEHQSQESETGTKQSCTRQVLENASENIFY